MIKYNSNYRGIVKSHGEAGKCQVFVPGVYRAEDENATHLPYAEPAQPLFAGNDLGQGVFQYPLIGSTVWVFFENGDHNKPIFFASAQGGETAEGNFASDKSSTHDRSTKYIIKTEHATLTFNDTETITSLEVQGFADVYVKDAVTIHCDSTLDAYVKDAVTIQCDSTLDAYVKDAVTIQCDSTLDAHAVGNMSVKTDANMLIQSAGVMNIIAGGVMSLTAPTINLN